MSRMIFVNLPITDLAKTEAFYRAFGWNKNPHFSNDNSLCMVWSDTIYAMLLSHERWADFTTRPIPDAHTTCPVMLALNVDDRQTVDDIVTTAAAAGGRSDPNPAQDFSFMYSRSVADPDGHLWELFWMDPAAVPQEAEGCST